MFLFAIEEKQVQHRSAADTYVARPVAYVAFIGWHGHWKRAESDDLAGFYNHDAASATLRDWRIVAAIEERLHPH